MLLVQNLVLRKTNWDIYIYIQSWVYNDTVKYKEMFKNSQWAVVMCVCILYFERKYKVKYVPYIHLILCPFYCYVEEPFLITSPVITHIPVFLIQVVFVRFEDFKKNTHLTVFTKILKIIFSTYLSLLMILCLYSPFFNFTVSFRQTASLRQ
jgi:hypothetical protein